MTPAPWFWVAYLLAQGADPRSAASVQAVGARWWCRVGGASGVAVGLEEGWTRAQCADVAREWNRAHGHGDPS